MIDLESELKFMAEEYNIPEKRVLNWWRTAVRQMWSNSPFMDKLRKEAVYKMVNTNPKSMKRFPLVDRINCVKCGKPFAPADMNLDHISGDNKSESLADAEKFMKSILFTPRSNLQWLCDDLQKTVNKKKVTKSIGCHSQKSQLEANPELTEHEAWVIRETGRIEKYENMIDKLLELGVELENIPKFKNKQKELISKLLREGFVNEN